VNSAHKRLCVSEERVIKRKRATWIESRIKTSASDLKSLICSQ
jgi:hypothetical protein